MWPINRIMVDRWEVVHHPKRRFFFQCKYHSFRTHNIVCWSGFTHWWKILYPDIGLLTYSKLPSHECHYSFPLLFMTRSLSFPYISNIQNSHLSFDNLIFILFESYAKTIEITYVLPTSTFVKGNPNYCIKLHELQSHKNHHHQKWSH
jgi:hypothetical protein